MKILLFTNTDWSLYNFRVPLAKELRKMGHSVVMASPVGKFVPKIEEAGFKHLPVTVHRTGMNPVNELQTIRELKTIFAKEKPDVVHNFTPKGVLYGTTAAKWSGIDHIVNSITGLGYMFEDDQQGLKNNILRQVILKWYKFALSGTEVIFQNEEDLEYLESKKILSRANPHVIRSSGVDVNRFIPEYYKNESPIIGLPARMVRAKGVGTFISAADILKREYSINARFVLAGDVDPTRSDSFTEQELKEWEEKDVIEWWGYQDDMPSFYKQANIICLPSYGKEGVPRTLIEAASAGKPIVTTDNTGCRDAVIDGKTGFIVPIKDSESLAEKLKHLIENSELRKQMGQRGREFAEETFAMDLIAKQTEDIYNSVIQ
jgi:glycosyltransferase involved in cell wall biosynthesis